MIRIVFFMFIIIICVLMYKHRIKIKFHTFFKKGFRSKRGNFGVYCYDGKQGSFKTYSVVEFLLQNKDKKIYSNIHTLKGVEYTPIGDFDDLLNLRSESNCIIVYDEIFTALTRTTKMNTDVLDFLSQMRKRQIIFLTTAQEWLEINITLRRYCRYRINCTYRTFPFLSTIIIKKFYDAENMKWSNEDNEYVAPLLSTTISKSNVDVANAYDTFEQIESSQCVNEKNT